MGNYAEALIEERREERCDKVKRNSVEEMWTTWCAIAERVVNFAQCKQTKNGISALGPEHSFKMALPTKSKPMAEDPGPYKARKMAHAIRRVEELQRNGGNPARSRRSEETWQRVVRASRTVFAGRIPPDLLPSNMPGHEA